MLQLLCFSILLAISALPGYGQESFSARTLENSLELAEGNRKELLQAIQDCQGSELEKKSIQFLITNMPASDLKSLTGKYLVSNIKLAIQARNSTEWAKRVPVPVFLNDVLPYASINERRDEWRKDFFLRFKDLVKGAKTTGEAAQILNKNVFQILKVRYSTKRKKADQSPYESMDSGLASCTGLSVILVDACRAVGVPARIAGTPLWVNKRGNHTWVEVWDEGDWKFTGACEYDANGLNRGWFQGIAAKADPTDPKHRIYATSFRKTNGHFPMVWKRRSTNVPGIDVTARYTGKKSVEKKTADKKHFLVAIQIYDRQGKRIATKVSVVSESRTAQTKPLASGKTRSESNDANDLLEVSLPAASYLLRFEWEGKQVSRKFKVEEKINQLIKIKLGVEGN